MTKHLTLIDIRSLPDLLRLAEEVKVTQTPRILKKADETVAILMPVGTATKPKKKRAKTKAETPNANKKALEATLALAGSWKDLDWNEMEAELDRIRHHSKPTPPLTV